MLLCAYDLAPRTWFKTTRKLSAARCFQIAALLLFVRAAVAQISTTATTATIATHTITSGATVYTVTASVATASGPVPVGLVDFLDNNKLLSTVQIVQSSAAGFIPGTATFSKLLPPGAHSIVAHFRGTNTLGPSTSVALAATVAGVPNHSSTLYPSGYYTPSGSPPLVDITLADVNNDGLPDIIVPRFSSKSFAIFSNDPSNPGHFLAPQIVPMQLGETPYKIQVADIDGDGLPDVVVSVPDSQSPSSDYFAGIAFCYLQNPSQPGTFQTPVELFLWDIFISSITIGDVDNDGVPDVVVQGPHTLGGYGIAVFTQNASKRGTFEDPAWIDIDNGSYIPLNMAIADMDGDRRPDIALSGESGNAVRIYYADPDHAGYFNRRIDFAGSPSAYSMQLLDINHDGLPDVVLGGVAAGVQVLLNDPAHPGSLLHISNYPVPDRSLGIAISDVDGDGNPDVTTANFSNSIAVLLGDGKGSLSPPVLYGTGGTATTEIEPVASADLDGDGLDDIVTSLWTENELLVFLHKQVQGPILTLSSDLTTYSARQPATYTAILSNTTPVSGLPISFMDSGVLLGTASTNAAGIATLSIPSLSGGAHSITATDITSGITTAAIKLTVSPDPTAVTLTGTPAAPLSGQSMSFRIKVTNTLGSLEPSGLVALTDSGVGIGTVALDANGQATITTSPLVPGTHNFVATYLGTIDFGVSSAASSILVPTPDFNLNLNPSSLTLLHGQSGYIEISLSAIAGFADTVKFSCGSLPQYASCSFSPATPSVSVAAAQVVQLTVSTGASSVSRSIRGIKTSSTQNWMVLLTVPFFCRFRSSIRKRNAQSIVPCLLMGLVLVTLCGCSSGKDNNEPPPVAAPGVYTFTINAASATQAHNVNVALTIQ